MNIRLVKLELLDAEQPRRCFRDLSTLFLNRKVWNLMLDTIRLDDEMSELSRKRWNKKQVCPSIREQVFIMEAVAAR